MVKSLVLTISTLVLVFLAAVGTVLAQSASPSGYQSPSPTASPRTGGTTVVPSGAPSTGRGL